MIKEVENFKQEIDFEEAKRSIYLTALLNLMI
jgi:hypothetical protein